MPSVSIYDTVYQIVTFIDSVTSIVVASVGVYIYLTKRKSIKGFFNLLTNYSLQNTIYELFEKLNKLNDFSADDKNRVVKNDIQCLLQDIKGQIEGNKFLKDQFVSDFEELHEYFDNSKKLTEPDKRRIVSRIREKLRTLNLETYSDLARKDDE